MQSCSKISGDLPAACDAVLGVLTLALLQLLQLIGTENTTAWRSIQVLKVQKYLQHPQSLQGSAEFRVPSVLVPV